MTKEQAINELKEDKALYMPEEWIEELDRDTPDGRLITALDMAIKAIEQQPCEDCVSRQALINNYNVIETPVGYRKVVDMQVVEDIPPVTPTQRWIPVSERLPEDRNIVLVTAYWHGTYQVMMASYFGEGLWWCVPFNNCGDHMQKLNPKAWSPLPQPYEE